MGGIMSKEQGVKELSFWYQSPHLSTNTGIEPDQYFPGYLTELRRKLRGTVRKGLLVK